MPDETEAVVRLANFGQRRVTLELLTARIAAHGERRPELCRSELVGCERRPFRK
jgi:hypothetical protein